jgi:hypothetical protein
MDALVGRTIRPRDEADARIRDVLIHRDPAVLPAVLGLVDCRTADLLATFAAGSDDPAGMLAIARSLAAGNWPVSALTAFERALSLVPGGDYPALAAILSERIALQRHLGMTLAVRADGHLLGRLLGSDRLDEELPVAEADGFEIVDAWNRPADYADLARRYTPASLRNDPLRDPLLTKSLFLAEEAGSRMGRADDLSFFVLGEDGEPLIQVECDVLADRHLGCRETAVTLSPLSPSGGGEAAQSLALRQLLLFAAFSGARRVLFEMSDELALAPAVVARLRRSCAWARDVVHAWIDLEQDEGSIVAGYRQTTRHSVRWGRENMGVIASADGGADIAALYQDMHRKIGKDPVLNQVRLAEELASGKLNVFVGFFQDMPACLVTTSDHGSTTYDMATLRTLTGGASYSHIVIHHAIMHAKARGQSRFDFGNLFTDPNWDAKLQTIARFKAGFAGSQSRLVWLNLCRWGEE